MRVHGDLTTQMSRTLRPAWWQGMVLNMAPMLGGVSGRRQPDYSVRQYDGAMNGTASAFTITACPYGPALRFNGNAFIEWTAVAGVSPTRLGAGDDTRITVSALVRYAHKATTNLMYVFRSDNRIYADTLSYGFAMVIEANLDRLEFYVNRATAPDPDPAARWYSPNASLTPGKWHALTVTFWPQDLPGYQRCMMWIDGQMLFPTNPVTEYNPVHHSARHARCGASFGSTVVDFEIGWLGVWNQRLPDQQIVEMHADPLKLFRKPRAAGMKGARLVSIGGTALRRMNVVLTGG